MKRLFTAIVVVGLAAIAFVSVRKPTQSQSGDDEVIKQLRLAGSDLSKPHPVDFYIYVPSKEAAERVAGVLSGRGFQTKVEPPIDNGGWLALASKSVVPTSSALADLRRDLTSLANREHGEYDGWEAAVVK